MNPVFDFCSQGGQKGPVTQEFTKITNLRGRAIGAGNQIRPPQMGQGPHVDFVGLDSGRGDRFGLEGVSHQNFIHVAGKTVVKERPVSCGLENKSRGPRKPMQKTDQIFRGIRQPFFFEGFVGLGIQSLGPGIFFTDVQPDDRFGVNDRHVYLLSEISDSSIG